MDFEEKIAHLQKWQARKDKAERKHFRQHMPQPGTAAYAVILNGDLQDVAHLVIPPMAIKFPFPKGTPAEVLDMAESLHQRHMHTNDNQFVLATWLLVFDAWFPHDTELRVIWRMSGYNSALEVCKHAEELGWPTLTNASHVYGVLFDIKATTVCRKVWGLC